MRIILLVVIASQTAFAEATEISDTIRRSRSTFSFQIGFPRNYLKDLSFSPLNNRAGGLAVNTGFKRSINNDHSHLYFNISFITGKFKSSESSFSSSQYFNGNVELGYLMKVKSTIGNKSGRVFLGPQYNSLIHYMQWKEMDSWSYLMYHGISIKGLTVLPLINKKHFEIGLSLPLAGILVRPPYNGYDYHIEQNQEEVLKLAFLGKMASWNLYRGFDWRVSYVSPISERVGFICTYTFRYQYSNTPQSINYFQNNVTIGLMRI